MFWSEKAVRFYTTLYQEMIFAIQGGGVLNGQYAALDLASRKVSTVTDNCNLMWLTWLLTTQVPPDHHHPVGMGDWGVGGGGGVAGYGRGPAQDVPFFYTPSHLS